MRNIKIYFVLSVILFAIAGCNSCNQKTAIQQEKIKIGVVAPLTGDGATYGASMKRGFDLAFEGDSTYKLLYEDSKFESKLAVTILEKYISIDNVKVIFGEAASGVTLAMVPISDKNKVIQFSSIASTDDLQKSSEYFFRNVPRNSFQAKTVANFIYNNLNFKMVAILKDNDAYGLNLAKDSQKLLKL